MKKYGIMLACILAGSVTACADPMPEGAVLSGEEYIPAQEEEQTIKENIPQKGAAWGSGTEENTESGKIGEEISKSDEMKQIEKNKSPDEERRTAYISVLENLYSEHVFPNDKDYGFDEFFDISENKFAIYDIDSDGKDELLIEYTTTFTAGMIEIVYDYDGETSTVKEQFSEFPALTFYDNGVIEAKWSHNQGRGGEFWPYSLYQYHQETDAYIQVGMADAWDKSISEQDYDGIPFPEEIDVDGDGIVYYIMTGGEYEITEPVDSAEYQKWRTSYIGEAKQMDIPFRKLTKENIAEE